MKSKSYIIPYTLKFDFEMNGTIDLKFRQKAKS